MSRLRRAITLLLLAGNIAFSSPAGAVESTATLHAKKAYLTSLKTVRAKIDTATKDDLPPIVMHLQAYLLSLARDIEVSIESGKFEEAEKEIIEYTRELKLFRKLARALYGRSAKITAATEEVARLAVKRVKEYVNSIEAAVLENRFEDIKPIYQRYKALLETIKELDNDVPRLHIMNRCLQLIKIAKRKIDLPEGTYRYKRDDFSMVVQVKWDGLRLRMSTNAEGRRPTKQQFGEMMKGASETIIDYSWKAIGGGRSKRYFRLRKSGN
ncbi:TPA: hypothetical protein HA278_00245 [Candidatus Woesearchaeota archaeon]|nr:hypothetical protein [archaeon]HIJ10458.1 hypothetical protein [Candidatus Woesearchaeota archaeon]|tara:strand:- start:500 stop:1306 length:807 start_codon:yes stop_codon:yes gene_type:complete